MSEPKAGIVFRGVPLTEGDVVELLEAARGLALSYAMADPDNDGDNHIEWEWIDSDAGTAAAVLSRYPGLWDEIIEEAKANNE